MRVATATAAMTRTRTSPRSPRGATELGAWSNWCLVQLVLACLKRRLEQEQYSVQPYTRQVRSAPR